MPQNNENKNGFFVKPTGSFVGFIATLAIGFILFFIMTSFKNVGGWLPYDVIVANADKNLFYKAIWSLMNFTEAEFYAGVFASVGVILGGFIAWRLDVKKSKLAGFNVCYGTNMWPWVFSSQILSLAIAVFVLNYTRFFNNGEYTWLPTFITVVGVPPAIMLIYGPSYKSLFTGSILGGIMSFPIAFWIMTNIIPVLKVPGVVSNVATMAITGIVIFAICQVLPWMKKTPFKLIENPSNNMTKEETAKAMSKPSWFIRRVFADFSEAQFYGNEIAGICVITGAILDWLLSSKHGAYGSGMVPAIILSQIVGSSVGVFLYYNKYFESGWYATYVPVVSVGPACVLMFGGSIPVAVFAGVLGGIIGAPLADYFIKKLPDGFHPTIGNVTSMAVTTTIVSVIMKVLPWF